VNQVIELKVLDRKVALEIDCTLELGELVSVPVHSLFAVFGEKLMLLYDSILKEKRVSSN